MKVYTTYKCECCGRTFDETQYPNALNRQYCAMLDCKIHEQECYALQEKDFDAWIVNQTIRNKEKRALV